MKKRRILGILLCCTLLLALLAACDNGDTPGGDTTSPDDTGTYANDATQQPPPEPAEEKIYTLDFSDGNIDFVRVNLSPRKADMRTAVEIMQLDGADALAISAPGGGEAHIGISLDDLLGDAVADVKMIVLDIYAECPDGKFSAVGGSIAAKTDGATVANTNWSVYISTRNPNQVVLEFGADQNFSADGANMLEISCTTNGPADKGETPAIIGIKNINFYDASNSGISINTSGAGWTGPEDYGQSSISYSTYELPLDERVIDGDFYQFYTFGVDNRAEEGYDDFMPWEVLASSIGIVFEMEEPEADIVIIHFGEHNGWDWNGGQNDVSPYAYADGKVTIMWDDLPKVFNPELLTEDAHGIKLRVGTWGASLNASKAYLLYTGGEPAGTQLSLPLDERVIDGDFYQFYTFGVDNRAEEGYDDFMPWDQLASSYGIVFEAEEPEADIVIIHFGEHNGWDWNGGQNDTSPYTYADGKITILWEDLPKVFDPTLLTEDAHGIKIRIGTWSGSLNATAAYLLVY